MLNLTLETEIFPHSKQSWDLFKSDVTKTAKNCPKLQILPIFVTLFS